MMGQQHGLQERLFYEFRLEDLDSSASSTLSLIDAVLDLGSLRQELARQ